MKPYLLIALILSFSLFQACKETGEGDDPSEDPTTERPRETEDPGGPCTFTLTSADMPEGVFIPTDYTAGVADELCSGGGSNTSPVLAWECVPSAGVASFAVTMWDIDYNAFDGDNYIHWVVYNLPAITTGLERGAGKPSAGKLPTGARHAPNDSIDSLMVPLPGYFGPCSGGADHRYQFTVWALNIANLEGDVTLAEIGIANATPTDFREAIERHDVGSSSLTRNSTGE